MSIKRPFARKMEPLDGSKPADTGAVESQGQGQEQPQQQPVRAARLPLPTPALPASKPAAETSIAGHVGSVKPVEALAAGAAGGVDSGSVERAKQVFANAGVDPSVVDKLVQRVADIDREVEKIDLEAEKLQRKKRELVEEKQRIMRIIKALAQA